MSQLRSLRKYNYYIDDAIFDPKESKKCSRCGRVKPLDCFFMRKTKNGHKPRAECKTCHHVQAGEYRQTERYRAWRKEHERQPEVAERRRERERQRWTQDKTKEKKRLYHLAYRATPLGKLRANKKGAKYRLGKAKNKFRLLMTLALYDREIARLA